MCIEVAETIKLTEPTLVWKCVAYSPKGYGYVTGSFFGSGVIHDTWMQAEGIGFHVFPRKEDAKAYPFGRRVVACWAYGKCHVGIQDMYESYCGHRVAWAVGQLYFNSGFTEDKPNGQIPALV